ncbi:MAG: hypothetical protein U0414_05380 [Polyangiaceae bacterium]
MKTRSFVVGYGVAAAAVVGLMAACGGKVTWVEDGAAQSGGAGGTGSTTKSSSQSTSKSSNVSTVQGTSVQGTSVQGTSVVASVVSTGAVMPGCDSGLIGNPGDDICNNCAMCSVQQFCFDQYIAFQNSPEAQDFLDCVNTCGGPMCQQKCQNQFPGGAMIYIALYNCIVCDTCANNCNAAQNCFGPPPPSGTSGPGGGPPPN